MIDDIKLCPFCGCKADVLEVGTESYNVFCRDCRAETAWFFTIKEAIEAWNKRA